ncbi:MAG: hypothetical protein HYV28_09095 [Ignavibacteriales bacterium]|nr:hypothetical protein [Ignavibacteriales bacterium]
MDGKVVGVVFSKMAGYGIEGMGFLRNVDFVRKAINRAPSLSQIDFKKTLGTSSLKAYKNLCLGQQKMWLSKMTDDNATRRLQIEGAKKLLFESIDEDARYADAHYFLAAFFFEEALTFCFDGQDYSANASAANFEKEVEKAISIKPSLQYNAATKSMKNYAANGKIKCTELRTIVLANRTTQINKLERIIEFNEYLESGEAPKVLQKTLRYGSAEYEHRSERTEGNTNNSSHEKLNPFMQVMERVNPSLAFTSVYLAKPLFKDGLDISFKNFIMRIILIWGAL